MAIEKRPQIRINLDSDSTSITLKYEMLVVKPVDEHGKPKTNDTTNVFVSISAHTRVKVRCDNQNSTYTANIKRIVACFSANHGEILRDILLNRYKDTIQLDDRIWFESKSDFNPTQIQPNSSQEFTFIVNDGGFDPKGKFVLHVMLVYENEFGVLYDTYKKVEVGLKFENIQSNLQKLYELSSITKGNTIPVSFESPNPVTFDQPSYTTYTYSSDEREMAIATLRRLFSKETNRHTGH